MQRHNSQQQRPASQRSAAPSSQQRSVRGSSQGGFQQQQRRRQPEPHRRLEVRIPAENLKAFAQAITFLCKVGKELVIEGTPDKLVLRTLNDTKSAYAGISFSQGFFELFRCDAGMEVEGLGAAPSVTCKILLKAVHNLFRTLRKVQRLVIAVEEADDYHVEPRLIFQVRLNLLSLPLLLLLLRSKQSHVRGLNQ
jgi:Rad9